MVEVETRHGTVAELHALDPLAAPFDPVIWRCRPTDDALVLGSRQGDELVDHDACRRAGLTVVRRRSGGGAVLLRRGLMHWVDIALPSGFAPADVRGSMVWIGELWIEALGHPDLHVHRGGMQCTGHHSDGWSDLVCFAGVGPGEVLRGDAKVVGLSQRRTRHGIRVQCLVPTAPVAAEYPLLFAVDVPPTPPGGEGALDDIEIDAVLERLGALMTPV